MLIKLHISIMSKYYLRFDHYPYPFARGTESKLELPAEDFLINMTKMSNDLCSEFDFVIIDFYIIDERVKIGELAFYPMSGNVLGNTIEIDKLWGTYLNSNC